MRVFGGTIFFPFPTRVAVCLPAFNFLPHTPRLSVLTADGTSRPDWPIVFQLKILSGFPLQEFRGRVEMEFRKGHDR
ncbi:hypothetical protein SCHPADRAFT_332931 [Schizopora paradoxa]|uniref:Uncharacterized protein n=1 Tax=Schizopora paradoxa TaxID=27342 RepID=A0A0H2SAU1_9AGAM|nr:hypothetical protein SCHPADRAFT_332931 [Schizopora paradoxa]